MNSDFTLKGHTDCEPERTAILNERNRVMRRVLRELSPREREVVKRFYVNEQSPAQICSEMSLTRSQFRSLKSKVRGRFEQLSKKKQIR